MELEESSVEKGRGQSSGRASRRPDGYNDLSQLEVGTSSCAGTTVNSTGDSLASRSGMAGLSLLYLYAMDPDSSEGSEDGDPIGTWTNDHTPSILYPSPSTCT